MRLEACHDYKVNLKGVQRGFSEIFHNSVMRMIKTLNLTSGVPVNIIRLHL
jgi:hypothetical protein